MKNKHAIIAATALLSLAVPARSQVKYGGYLALEYIKGQAESPYPPREHRKPAGRLSGRGPAWGGVRSRSRSAPSG